MPLRRHLLAGAAAAATLPIHAPRAGAEAVKVRLGTATPGGGFPVYGAAFIESVHRFDPALEIEAINTKGSTENVPMLEAGTLDIALVQGEVVHESLDGIGRPPADLKVITAMYPTAGLFVVRADSPCHRIADLLGKPIAWGAQGSGLVILGRYAMDGLGFDAAKDFKPIYLERAGDGPAMVLDGRAAALWGGGTGWPGFTAVARSDKGARFIAPDASEIARILAEHAFPEVGVPRRPAASPARTLRSIRRLVEFRLGATRPRRGGGLLHRQGLVTRRREPACRRRNWPTPRRRTRWPPRPASACIPASRALFLAIAGLK